VVFFERDPSKQPSSPRQSLGEDAAVKATKVTPSLRPTWLRRGRQGERVSTHKFMVKRMLFPLVRICSSLDHHILKKPCFSFSGGVDCYRTATTTVLIGLMARGYRFVAFLQ